MKISDGGVLSVAEEGKRVTEALGHGKDCILMNHVLLLTVGALSMRRPFCSEIWKCRVRFSCSLSSRCESAQEGVHQR